MRKVLFALDGDQFCQRAFDFVQQIHQQEAVHLTGLFIPAFTDDMQWVSPGEDTILYVPGHIAEEEILVRAHIQAFRQAASAAQIPFRLNSEPGHDVLESIRRETRFADLFVIGLDNYYQKEAGIFAEEELRQLIEHSECPVLLVPADAAFPERTIIAYDGSAGSVYALKMLAYLFPAIEAQRVQIVYAGADANSLPDQALVEELAACHFTDPSYSVLEFKPETYFVTWMEEQPRAMLVTGSYGRSEWSQLFKKSFLYKLLKEHPVPVFIAHK